MDRRHFTKSLCVAGLATPMILRASQGRANLDNIREKAMKRFVVQYGDEDREIDKLLIINAGFSLGLNLRAQMAVFNEDRSITNSAIAANLRPTLDDRISTSAKVGDVYLSGISLVVKPTVAELDGITKVILAHQDESFEPRGRPKRVRLNQIPAVSNMFKLGQARREKNHLIVFIRPVIVNLRD